MTTPSCAYCGHPLLTDIDCDDCWGWGGDGWRDATGEYVWEPCGKCGGSGTLDVCSNTICRLDGKDHLMLVNQRPRQQGKSAT